MALDPQLLAILACPDDKGPLLYFEPDGALVCPACARRYPVVDDIPDLLVEEAESLDAPTLATLLERAGREGIEPTFAA